MEQKALPKASCKPELRSPGSKLNNPTPPYTQGGRGLPRPFLACWPRFQGVNMQAVQRDKAEDFILLGLWASVRIQGVQRLRPTQPGLEGDSDLCPSHVCQRESFWQTWKHQDPCRGCSKLRFLRLSSDTAMEGLNRGQRGAGAE